MPSTPVVSVSNLIPASLVPLAALAVPALVWAASSLPFPFSVLASLLAMGAAYLSGKPIRPPRWMAGRAVLPLVLVPMAGTLSAALFSYSLTLSGWYALAAMAGAVVLAALAGLSEPEPVRLTPARGLGLDSGRALVSAPKEPTTSAVDDCSLGEAGQGKCK